jgi:hypothetical protein
MCAYLFIAPGFDTEGTKQKITSLCCWRYFSTNVHAHTQLGAPRQDQVAALLRCDSHWCFSNVHASSQRVRYLVCVCAATPETRVYRATCHRLLDSGVLSPTTRAWDPAAGWGVIILWDIDFVALHHTSQWF